MNAAAARALRSVHLVAPDGLHDPARPSGGNTYDRRLCSALAEAGWAVQAVRCDQVDGPQGARGGGVHSARS